MNPLLEISFRVPFDKIQASDVEPAIDELLADAQRRLDETIASDRPLHALDTMTERLDYAMSVVRHLESVATTPELRAAFNAVQPKVSAFYSSLPLNEELWKAMQRYAATDEARALTGTMKRYLTKTIDSFKRHGAELDPAGKARLKEIDVALAEITTKFSENVLDSTNAWDLVITEEAKLAGLPPSAMAAARASAESKGREGWRFTLQAPSYMAVMTYLDDAAIREQVWQRLQHARRASGTQRDNRPLIAKILELRNEKARLLGFRDFADLVLDDRMAHTGDRAQDFSKICAQKTEQRFREENRELAAFAGRELAAVGHRLLGRKAARRAVRFRRRSAAAVFSAGTRGGGNVRDLRTRAGHPRERRNRACRRGTRRCAATRFTTARPDKYLGSFYADWYPRENKRGGAWMDSLITGESGEERAASGADLRQSDAARGREAGAADASRSGDDFPRIRPSAASFAEPRGGAQPGGHQRRVGFRRAAVADHGELVLGARVAGFVRAAL